MQQAKKMIATKASPKIDFSLILRSKIKSVLFKASIYAMGVAVVSLAAGFAYVLVPVIFIVVFPFIYIGLLLYQSYKEYGLSKTLIRSVDPILIRGFSIEHGSPVKLTGTVGDQVVAISLGRSNHKHYLFIETLLSAGEEYQMNFTSPRPLKIA